MRRLSYTELCGADSRMKNRYSWGKNKEEPLNSPITVFPLSRASGTVYTAIDVATGQEVTWLHLVSLLLESSTTS